MSELKAIFAPWTDEQVAALNRFQVESGMHPFTCGGTRFDEKHGDTGWRLIATRGGWICSGCDYTQDWAHTHMANERALEMWIRNRSTLMNGNKSPAALAALVDRLVALPWTERWSVDDMDGSAYHILEIAELPGFLVAYDTREEIEREKRDALTAFVGSYVDRGELPPMPNPAASERDQLRERLEALSKQNGKAFEYKSQAVALHAALDAAGIDAAGECDDSSCNSRLEHRVHELIQARDALRSRLEAVKAGMEALKLEPHGDDCYFDVADVDLCTCGRVARFEAVDALLALVEGKEA